MGAAAERPGLNRDLGVEGREHRSPLFSLGLLQQGRNLLRQSGSDPLVEPHPDPPLGPSTAAPNTTNVGANQLRPLAFGRLDHRASRPSP